MKRATLFPEWAMRVTEFLILKFTYIKSNASGAKSENMIVGYNKDIKGYFGNKIKLKLITE
jgi:hypothetical protein